MFLFWYNWIAYFDAIKQARNETNEKYSHVLLSIPNISKYHNTVWYTVDYDVYLILLNISYLLNFQLLTALIYVVRRHILAVCSNNIFLVISWSEQLIRQFCDLVANRAQISDLLVKHATDSFFNTLQPGTARIRFSTYSHKPAINAGENWAEFFFSNSLGFEHGSIASHYF